MSEQIKSPGEPDPSGLAEHLGRFANGCRGSMWQSRDETIYLMEQAADRITALEAENEGAMALIAAERGEVIALRKEVDRLREALESISTYRKRCHDYDSDVGHEMRDFDREDVRLLEIEARAALKGGK